MALSILFHPCGRGLLGVLLGAAVVSAGEPLLKVDPLLEQHWQNANVTPANVADDGTLHRRLMLDLVGRIPTAKEAEAFASERANDKYARLVERLLASDEFNSYFATVLDELIQGRFAGSEPFVGYLRTSLREKKAWDTIFRELMLGPWDNDQRKPATGFLDKRVRDLDALTVDVTRTFFGVDISCARCHNHPLVRDWKKDHYYGMAAFFVRTGGGKGSITEKADGEAKFVGKDGQEKVAPLMFLSGKIEPEPPKPKKDDATKAKPFSRREALVRMSLDEKRFFSRAFVNRLWEYCFGQGLVNPSDQLHSGNPASIPTVLDALADDFVKHGYDIRRLLQTLVTSRAYRHESHVNAPVPEAGHFAVTRLRPLSARQFARSFILATGQGEWEPTPANIVALDKLAAELVPNIDPRMVDFQSSTREALYLSNSESLRKALTSDPKNIVERLAKLPNARDQLTHAFWTIYSRPPTESELAQLGSWLKKRPEPKSALDDLVWALVTSAEFRFNH